MNFFIDIAHKSMNKHGEILCGDNVEIYKDDEKTILVLADGLGSGVKANILATMTCKIAVTMLKEGESILETIDTIMNTLPVCKVRNLAYSTFAIIEISKDGNCSIIEYDNPPVFVVRDNQFLNLDKELLMYQDKKVYSSSFELQLGDQLTVVSDGVIHAGVGGILNLGWQWEHVRDFLIKESTYLKSPDRVSSSLLETCRTLYENNPGDDTTVASIVARKKELINLFSGPPENPEVDEDFVKEYMNQKGKKIVCGGTASKIVSRILDEPIETDLEYFDPKIPPIGHIKGIDLVTEGVLTLSRTIEILRGYAKNNEVNNFNLNKKDGASLLAKFLIEDCTHINIWVGNAINPAHQNPDFPIELSIKLKIVNDLNSILKELGKVTNLKYI